MKITKTKTNRVIKSPMDSTTSGCKFAEEDKLHSLKVFLHKFLLIINIIITIINHNYGGDLEDTILTKRSTCTPLIHKPDVPLI